MKLKRFICVLLACALLIVPAVRPARATGAGATVGIIGGAIGTGGAAGGIAAGSVLLPVLGVVGVVLAAYGINVALSDASQQAGLTKTQYIYSKIGEFARFSGVNVDAMVQGISQNIKVSPTGNIILDAAGGAVVSQFIDWLFSSGAVSTTGPNITVSGGLSIRGWPSTFDCTQDAITFNGHSFSLPDARFVGIYRQSQGDVYLTGVVVGSFSPGSVGGVQLTSVLTHGRYIYYGFVDCGYVDYHDLLPTVVPAYYYSGGGALGSQAGNIAVNMLFNGTVQDVLDGFQGQGETWTENKDLLKPGSEDAISINPDLLNPVIENAAAGDYTATVPDYLSALAHALDRADAGEVSLPVTNVATGAAVPLAVPSTAAAAPAITNVVATSPDVVGAGALADPAIPISPANAVPGLQFDLTQIFPFCIPFDLVDMITLLSADPVTPRFHLAWTFPIINAPVEFDVDLSQFDGVAAIVRPFELLIFVIGLALVTRDLIRG